MLAGHARRDIKPRRGASEAADFRDLGEDSHVVEAIHLSPHCEAQPDSLSVENPIIRPLRSFHIAIQAQDRVPGGCGVMGGRRYDYER